MNAHNQAFQNSLRCLGHPLSLFSIALLLLNDHLFKVISPSWLTGKLSDLAGLFFFPFVVAAGLSLLLMKFNIRLRTIGYVAFASVALWFVLFKTLAPVNHATNIVVSSLVSYPTQLLLDWTDTFALIAIWPSWRIWDQPFVRVNQRTRYLPLIIGLFACLATSPAQPGVEVVTHLVAKNENVIAFDSRNRRAAISEDGGRTWGWPDEDARNSVPYELKALPVSACWTNHPEECYSITRQKVMEESHDGGQSWETSWQLPVDRLSLMKRINPDVDFDPYDLLILEWESQSYALVAAGEEGILRKVLPDGEWDRIAVQDAVPTPHKAASMSNAASIIWKELLIWFLASILTFVGACWIVWSSNWKTSTKDLSKVDWIFSPAFSPMLGILVTLTIAVVIGLVFFTAMEITRFSGNITNILIGIFVICMVMALGILPLTIYHRLIKWKSTLIEYYYPPLIAQKIVWTSYLSHVSVLMVGILTWVSWTINIISGYTTSLVIALISSVLIAMILLRRIKVLSKQHNTLAEN